jgi:hypothetical protein
MVRNQNTQQPGAAAGVDACPMVAEERFGMESKIRKIAVHRTQENTSLETEYNRYLSPRLS